jgi:hypothetical protein
MAVKKTFSDLLADPSPVLAAKFDPDDKNALTIPIKNTIGLPINDRGYKYLPSVCKNDRLEDFMAFYKLYDGLELFQPFGLPNCEQKPLLTFISASNLPKFRDAYAERGEWGWIINHNKSKAIYRGGEPWMPFARVGNGPACLTIFLDGEHAGCVYLATPQPAFNILKPIAKSFSLLLERIAKDPAAFLRLVRAYVRIQRGDGYSYGYLPVEYRPELG